MMKYTGSELELFASAINWKRYWSTQIQTWIVGDVLEVGSGIGANINFLINDRITSWTALEPDLELMEKSRSVITRPDIKFINGNLLTIPPQPGFDTIIYIDVLEHIEYEKKELLETQSRLRSGGHLIILVPAYQTLFSPFDSAIGHYRRYNRDTLKQVIPPSYREKKLFYLDSVGVTLSFVNKLILGYREPTASQINFWDSYVIPASRLLDRIINYSFGRSLIGVWVKQ